jgi:hypothetical protein
MCRLSHSNLEAEARVLVQIHHQSFRQIHHQSFRQILQHYRQV